MTLKDKEIFEGAYNHFNSEDVKEAVLEDMEDLDNLIKSINKDDDRFSIRKKLQYHRKNKLRIFGNFEK